MNAEDTLLIMAWMACSIVLLKRRRSDRWKNRKWWVRPINQLRRQQGDYFHLYQQLKFDDDMLFRYIRMDLATFYEVLRMVHPYLIKTGPRALPLEHRLLTALRYYATGDLILSVSLAFRIGESTARGIIKEVAQALIQALAPIYLQTPNTNRWLQISSDFLRDWNFPNIAGAFDGKHFEIKAPPNSGSLFYNYKKSFSVVLLATCDANYKFTLVHVGEMGGNSDAGIFADSPIGLSLSNHEIGLPNGTAALPGSVETTPMMFVGDNGFPILPNLMVPYPGDHLEESRRIFNYRLSRARRIIENAFGILTARWRIFRRITEISVDTVDRIILATICLHNFLKQRDELANPPTVLYCPPQFVDRDENGVIELGQWRQIAGDDEQMRNLPTPARLTQMGMDIRNTLRRYFLTPEGEVPWQYECVRNVGNED